MAFGLGSAVPMLKPVSDWVDPRRNALMGLSAGFLQGDAGAAMRYAQQGAGVDRQTAIEAEEAARQQKMAEEAAALKSKYSAFFTEQGRPDIAQGIADGIVEPGAAYMDFIKPKDGGDALMSVGGHIYDKASKQWISPPESADNRQNVSLQGQWGVDAQGNNVLLQPSSTGEMVQAQVPEGVTLLGPYDVSANRAAGGAFGKQTGGAQFDLPSAKLIATQTITALNDIRAEKKGMDEQFGTLGISTPFGDIGIPQQMTPAWPKSDKAKFQVAVQRGTDRAFLEAREMLRGGGQITDFESRKAETAITSMQIAMEKGDKAQFQKALDDFEQAVKDGVTKLESQAGAMPGYGGAAPAGGSDYKSKYGLE